MAITGRLTRNSIVHRLHDEGEVVNFSIAVNDYFKSRNGERVKTTTYFNCAYWISTKVTEILRKGTLVEVTGRVYVTAYPGADGTAKASLNCHVSSIKFHAWPKEVERWTAGEHDSRRVRKYGGTSLRSGAEQSFKVSAGYQVKVCCNLCVWTDGLLSNVRVKTIQQLRDAIYHLLCEYDAMEQLRRMEAMLRYSLTEQQFAQLLGKARLYQYLPSGTKSMYPEFLFTDTMLNQVARDYYSDSNFGREFNGDLSLWKVYNLLTNANKSSYIDLFLRRAANASSFVGGLASALEQGSPHWFLR